MGEAPPPPPAQRSPWLKKKAGGGRGLRARSCLKKRNEKAGVPARAPKRDAVDLDQGGKWPGGEIGPMCDAEKDWHERFFRASGEINGCQKFPLNEPEITFSFFISEPPVAYFQKPF